MSDIPDRNVSQIPMQSDLLFYLRSALELGKLDVHPPNRSMSSQIRNARNSSCAVCGLVVPEFEPPCGPPLVSAYTDFAGTIVKAIKATRLRHDKSDFSFFIVILP